MLSHRLIAGLVILNLLLLAVLLTATRSSASAESTHSVLASQSALPELPVVRTRRLEIVDERGRVRSRINVESNGEVVLRMTGRSGDIRVKLGADEDGSGLLLLDETTAPGVHIMARRTATADRSRTTNVALHSGTRSQMLRP